MGSTLIFEKKIKCVHGARQCGISTVLHIPSKMFVFYNFRQKLDVTQNQQKYEIEIKYRL